MDLITFIIPSVGRPTLQRALDSLRKQTIQNWKAIVCFDRVKPTIKEDDKISVLQFTGSTVGWRAGLVRNYAMRFVKTPWIGLLDDDDSVTQDYLQRLWEYTILKPHIIVFQMQFTPDKILPRHPHEMFSTGKVGISFAFQTEILQKVQFKGMKCEDVTFLRDARNKGLSIVLCPHVTYHVNY